MHAHALTGLGIGEGRVGGENQRQTGATSMILTTGRATGDFLRVGHIFCGELGLIEGGDYRHGEPPGRTANRQQLAYRDGSLGRVGRRQLDPYNHLANDVLVEMAKGMA